MAFESLRRRVADYYAGKLESHGAVARGVDWNSEESQELRFEQLLKVCRASQPFSLNDFGCGYGALASHLQERGVRCDYHGFDVAPAMLDRARERMPESDSVHWHATEAELPVSDYTIASGVFNVKADAGDEEWRSYVWDTIDVLAARSRRGFAFNVLTRYSDAEFMDDRLHYADPLALFDRCQRRYSRWVSLLHDYGLYEFTLLVQLEGGRPWRSS